MRMTSAPMAAKKRVAPAPASWPEKSQIRSPPRARGGDGSGRPESELQVPSARAGTATGHSPSMTLRVGGVPDDEDRSGLLVGALFAPEDPQCVPRREPRHRLVADPAVGQLTPRPPERQERIVGGVHHLLGPARRVGERDESAGYRLGAYAEIMWWRFGHVRRRATSVLVHGAPPWALTMTSSGKNAQILSRCFGSCIVPARGTSGIPTVMVTGMSSSMHLAYKGKYERWLGRFPSR